MGLNVFLKFIWNLPTFLYIKLRVKLITLRYGEDSERAEELINALISSKLQNEHSKIYVRASNCFSIILYSITNNAPGSGVPVCSERFQVVSQYGIFKGTNERDLFIAMLRAAKDKNERSLFHGISEWIRQYETEDGFYAAYANHRENNKEYDSTIQNIFNDILSTEEVKLLGVSGINSKFGHMLNK